MTSIDVTIAQPENDSPGELIKGYFTLMRSFGWDLYITCHFGLRSELGINWFAARMTELKESDPKNWNPRHRFDPQDPTVILRDYVHETDSPYLKVLGGQEQKLTAARKILGTRNTWFHFGDDPTLAELGEAAKIVKGFVASTGMKIGSRIDGLTKRIDDLKSGRYPVEIEPASQTTAATPEPKAPEPTAPGSAIAEQVEVPADLPRPPIGGTWVGEIPGPRYRITKTGDVINPETLESIKSKLSGDPTEKLRAWTAVEPRGRELWIDTDGAVGGFIGASPRLLGYLGPDPEGEIARGFFLPYFYIADGNDVIDLDSGERIASPLGVPIDNGRMLRITTYGDVLTADDSAGVERVGTVHTSNWFPGHLG
ncbi:MAG: hypothetical protein IT192_07120 [Microbacteriaceae bacterium]|nr:hypothetical protein [Microbacteriaceae bacterium]